MLSRHFFATRHKLITVNVMTVTDSDDDSDDDSVGGAQPRKGDRPKNGKNVSFMRYEFIPQICE